MSKLKLILFLIIIVLIVYVAIVAFDVKTSITPIDELTTNIRSLTVTKVTTTLSTVYGLIGVTGISLAATTAIGYAYKQIKGQLGQAVATVKNQSQNLDFLSRQTDEISTASNLKDAALTKLNTEKTAISTELSGYKTQVQTMTQQLETQKQTLEVLGKNAQSQIQASLPSNEIFTSADGKKQIIKIAEKYVT